MATNPDPKPWWQSKTMRILALAIVTLTVSGCESVVVSSAICDATEQPRTDHVTTRQCLQKMVAIKVSLLDEN
jgi:uncharacterized protein YceK